LIWFGGGQVVQHAVTLGVLIAFIQYTERFFRPIQDLAEKYNILQAAMASSERIFRVLDELVTVEDPTDPAPLPRVRGQIEFRNVWFAYPATEPAGRGEAGPPCEARSAPGWSVPPVPGGPQRP